MFLTIEIPKDHQRDFVRYQVHQHEAEAKAYAKGLEWRCSQVYIVPLTGVFTRSVEMRTG